MGKLHEAAGRNDVMRLKRLLSSGEAIENVDAEHRTALIVAVIGDSLDAAEILLAAGCGRLNPENGWLFSEKRAFISSIHNRRGMEQWRRYD